ncbi:MAG: hypothetical protein R2854_25505 [Caldilineaceae bacterium]
MCQDLAAVGYDNMPEAAYFLPALTSVRQHLIDGRLADGQLHTLVAAPERRAATDRVCATHRAGSSLCARAAAPERPQADAMQRFFTTPR